MVNAAPQEKSYDAEGLKLPNGRQIVVEQARGHGFFKLGFADKQPFNFPDRFAGKYTKVDYALEDAAIFVKQYWDAFREEENKRLAERLKEEIALHVAQLKEQKERQELEESVVEAVQPKKRGRKPKAKPEVVEVV